MRMMARAVRRGLGLASPAWGSHIVFQVSRASTQVEVQAQPARHLSNSQVRVKRSRMFEEERRRQANLIPRLEKIEVQYSGPPDAATLILNRGISTPYNVAQHMSEMLMARSCLALVSTEDRPEGQLWDMHRPLEDDCTVELLHFHTEDPIQPNRAFWRSCSFLLGAAIDSAFKDDIAVHLHSFPAPSVASGSFVADVSLGLEGGGHSWSPSREELMVFSAQMHRLSEACLPFHRLAVDAGLAMEMFQENPHKSAQIPSIAASPRAGGKVTLYKVGEHVDISGGPMVADTSFVGRRCTIPAAHPIHQSGAPLYRFQGVALPKEIHLNHFAYSVLERRAARLNLAGLNTTRVPSPV